MARQPGGGAGYQRAGPEADHDAVEALLDASFGISRRTKTSYRLRAGNRAIDGLSLVTRDKGTGLSGTISFWPLAIGIFRQLDELAIILGRSLTIT